MTGQGEILTAGGELARGRLALYARLAELVLEQEAALEAEDLDRFNELSRMVSAVQERLGIATQGLESATEEQAGPDQTDEAARLLRVTLARTERIHSRLSMLRRQVGDEIRHVETGRKTGRRYMEASGSGSADAVPKVDVKL